MEVRVKTLPRLEPSPQVGGLPGRREQSGVFARRRSARGGAETGVIEAEYRRVWPPSEWPIAIAIYLPWLVILWIPGSVLWVFAGMGLGHWSASALGTGDGYAVVAGAVICSPGFYGQHLTAAAIAARGGCFGSSSWRSDTLRGQRSRAQLGGMVIGDPDRCKNTRTFFL
jgi:hypothetical protein